MSLGRLALTLGLAAVAVLAAPVAGTPSPAPVKRTVKVVVVGTGFVRSSPAGIACPPRCSAKFALSAAVTLTAVPEIGFVLSRWRGACSGRGRCVVSPRGRPTVVAVFAHAPSPPPAPPAPPPPPPPPPAAMPGHYVGKTSHVTDISFDVNADSSRIENIRTGQINVSCTPPLTLQGGDLNIPWLYLDTAGAFSYSWSGESRVASVPSTYSVAIAGRFSSGTASGTIRTTIAFTWTDGVARTCDSGVVTFTATRT